MPLYSEKFLFFLIYEVSFLSSCLYLNSDVASLFAYCCFASVDRSQEVFIFMLLLVTVWSCSAGFVYGAVSHFSIMGEKETWFSS